MDDLVASLLFLTSAELIIEADKLLLEANRVEQRNPPWARNRRRRADKLMAKARQMCGDRSMPWGVV